MADTKQNQEMALSAYQKRFDSLKREYDQYLSLHKDLSDYINPKRGIFNGDRTKLGRKIDHQKLLNSYATHAQRVLASGLMSGMTNKSVEWFRLTLDNIQMLELPDVREWMDSVQQIMFAVMNKSNIYDVFYHCYEEIGQFGPGCFMVLDDYLDVIRGKSFTVGEYYLATDEKGRVNKFAREFELTVGQMVNEFGLESVSSSVRAQYENNQREVKIKICHLIEENMYRKEDFVDSINMKFISVYWENGNKENLFLAKRGFRRFPVVAPRWETITTDDVYGSCPGVDALGAIKELQKTRKDKLISQEKMHTPPMQEDSSVTGTSNYLPGGITKTEGSQQSQGVRPAYQINPALESFLQLIEEEKEEIDRFFFVNLFLMLLNIDKTNMTATEVAERQQEKLMMLGPVLHRLDEEMLSPTLDLVFAICEENQLFPQAPDSILGQKIKIEYTSILAQAQMAMGVTKIERVIGVAGQLLQVTQDPSSVDSLDADECLRQSAEMEGAVTKIIKSKEEVEAIREQRQQQQQMAQMSEMANQGADTANKLAGAKTDESNAMTSLLQNTGR